LFDDACDEGFTLVSHKTGKHVMFYYVDKVYDEEGDVIQWKFEECELRPMETNGTRVAVLND